MKKLLAMGALTFLGTVSGKFSFGPCPADLPQMTYSEYQGAADEAVGYRHDIIGLDRGFADMLESVQVLGFKLPLDYKCDDLGTIAPWKGIAKRQFDAAEKLDAAQTDFDGVNFSYLDDDAWDSVFSEREDAFHRLVHIDTTYWTSFGYFPVEFHYLCADTFSLPALVDFASYHGVKPAGNSISLAESLNSLFGMFRKFGFTFRLHGLVVTDFADDETFNTDLMGL